jgi:hypothetical protein
MIICKILLWGRKNHFIGYVTSEKAIKLKLQFYHNRTASDSSGYMINEK